VTILFGHSVADLYGASRSLLRLAGRLARDGHTVMAVLPGSGPLEAELERAGVEVYIRPELAAVDRRNFNIRGMAQTAGRLTAHLFRLAAFIRRRRVELVHTNTALILSTPLAARLAKCRHLWHIRESFAEFPRLWPLWRRVMLGLSDRIVAVSEAVARQFGGEGAGRVRVIHNGFPRTEFDGVSPARVADFKRRFGLDGGPLVAVIGRLKLRRKGQEVFLKAASMLAGRFPAARFLLIGSPYPGNEAHLEELKRIAAELGISERVVFTGDVEDIKAAYAALDVAVLPGSLPEPFGGVVIESMAMGKPVVGTRLGGTVEQIVDGETGFLVEPDNPAELAARVEQLLANEALRREMGRRGRERFLRHFEFETFYKRITDLYGEILRF